MLFVLLLVLSLNLLIFKIWLDGNIKKLIYIFNNGLWGFPVIGHYLVYNEQTKDHMNLLRLPYYRALNNGRGTSCLWIGKHLYTVMTDIQVIDIVLKECLEKHDIMTVLSRNLLGTGIIIAPVPKWRKLRKILNPGFSTKSIHKCIDVFVAKSSITTNKLETLEIGQPFSIWYYFAAYFLASVFEIYLGISLDHQNDQHRKLLESFDEYLQLLFSKLLLPWRQIDFVFRLLPAYKIQNDNLNVIFNGMNELLHNKLKATETKEKEENNKHNSTADMTMCSEYSYKELLEEALVLIFAGSDTPSATSSFATVMLSRLPAIQDKVYQELYEIFGDSNRPIAGDDLPKMKYLDAVIMETLRLYPPAPYIVRNIDKDLYLPSGLTLPKNTGAVISIWGANRDPRHWGPDAESFNPDRFMGSMKPSTLRSFSSGPRNCIGQKYAMMSIKIVLANILRKYRILPVMTSPNEDLSKPLKVKFDVILRHIHGYRVKVEPRTTNNGVSEEQTNLKEEPSRKNMV